MGVWERLKRDVQKVKDDLDESRRKEAEKFSAKVYRKNKKAMPHSEWIYAETQSRREMRMLVGTGWEVVTTSQKATATGSSASVYLPRKKNEGN